jgi:hypothetical protein
MCSFVHYGGSFVHFGESFVHFGESFVRSGKSLVHFKCSFVHFVCSFVHCGGGFCATGILGNSSTGGLGYANRLRWHADRVARVQGPVHYANRELG